MQVVEILPCNRKGHNDLSNAVNIFAAYVLVTQGAGASHATICLNYVQIHCDFI